MIPQVSAKTVDIHGSGRVQINLKTTFFDKITNSPDSGKLVYCLLKILFTGS